MLDISNLKVDIEGSRILNGVSLTVGAGELVCLVGRNGAGKTTTFRSIMGYRRPLSGGINFDGADLTKLPTWQIAQAGIGFAPEESEVYADLTVAENIELSTWTRPSGRAAGVRIEEAYKVLEVSSAASNEEVAKAYRRQLSRHHPDKLKANGLPESMIEHAKERTQQIIEAYDLIKERRGI